MSSEWMKVMLDEIARKKAEAEQEQAELERRRSEQQRPTSGVPGPARSAVSRPAKGRPDDSA